MVRQNFSHVRYIKISILLLIPKYNHLLLQNLLYIKVHVHFDPVSNHVHFTFQKYYLYEQTIMCKIVHIYLTIQTEFNSLDDCVTLYQTTIAAKSRQPATQKHANSVVASTTTISSVNDSALQPPPSKQGRRDPLQVFEFENYAEEHELQEYYSQESQDFVVKATEGIQASPLVSNKSD